MTSKPTPCELEHARQTLAGLDQDELELIAECLGAADLAALGEIAEILLNLTKS